MNKLSKHFDFTKDPFAHFEDALNQAKKTIPKDPNAVYLATSTVDAIPSVRTVLFKGLLRNGFSFYTNYESQKAKELIQNPRAAMLFYWPSLDHQIRIDGTVEKTTRAESEAYFKTRARISQVGAWASRQSETLDELGTMTERADEIERKFSGVEIPCPPHWGGFLLMPLRFEFWYGKTGRMHERYVFERTAAEKPWQTFMKYP